MRLRKTPPAMIVLVLILGGCSTSKHQTQPAVAPATTAGTPVSLESVESCLEHMGYEVREHATAAFISEHPHDVNDIEELDIIGGASEPGGLSGDFVAQGSAGKGEATVAVYTTSAQAQKAASETVQDTEKAQANPGSEAASEAAGKAGWHRNVAAVAWSDTALALENIAGCAE